MKEPVNIDLVRLKDCKNMRESFGEHCVKCNKCGKFDTKYKSKCPFCKIDFYLNNKNSNIDIYMGIPATLKQHMVTIKCPICENLYFSSWLDITNRALKESE